MRKIVLIYVLAVLLFIIAAALIVVSGYVVVTGKVIDFEDNIVRNEKAFDYTWTTAVCDSNYCRDYEVVCLDGNVVRMDPISGVVHISDDGWTDTREEIELCER